MGKTRRKRMAPQERDSVSPRIFAECKLQYKELLKLVLRQVRQLSGNSLTVLLSKLYRPMITIDGHDRAPWIPYMAGCQDQWLHDNTVSKKERICPFDELGRGELRLGDLVLEIQDPAQYDHHMIYLIYQLITWSFTT